MKKHVACKPTRAKRWGCVFDVGHTIYTVSSENDLPACRNKSLSHQL